MTFIGHSAVSQAATLPPLTARPQEWWPEKVKAALRQQPTEIAVANQGPLYPPQAVLIWGNAISPLAQRELWPDSGCLGSGKTLTIWFLESYSFWTF